MKVSFCAARRFHIAIRIAAGVIASLLTILLAVFLLLLWFFPGFDFSVSDIFGAIYRFFVRLFCGHALRPLTLHQSVHLLAHVASYQPLQPTVTLR